MRRDPTTKRQVCQNQHCATHYQFKVDAQAFDLVRKPLRYFHISRADKDWLVSQHPRIEPFHAAVVPKKLRDRCSDPGEDGLQGNQLSKLVVAVVSKLENKIS